MQISDKYWDSIAPDYDRLVRKFYSRAYQVLTENVIQDAHGSECVLDVAGGTGILAVRLSPYVSTITVVDQSNEMLRIAGEKADKFKMKNIHVRAGDIYHLPFDDHSFETVIAANVLHLLVDPHRALIEINRVLKPGGKLIIPTFCHGATFRSWLYSSVLTMLGQRPRQWWSRNGFRKFMESTGLTVSKELFIDDKIPLLYLVASGK